MMAEMRKKAQIATTITWVVAIVVIFLMMAIYLFVVGSMKLEKTFFGKDKTQVIVDHNLQTTQVGIDNYAMKQDLYSILNEKIGWRGVNQSIYNIVVQDLEVYFTTVSEYEKIGSLADRHGFSPKIDDVANVGVDVLVSEGFNAEEIKKIKLKDEQLGYAISNVLKGRCSKFLFLIPEGLITEDGMLASRTIRGNEIFLDTPEKLEIWTPVQELTTKYRGHEIQIKYRELIGCKNE